MFRFGTGEQRCRKWVGVLFHTVTHFLLEVLRNGLKNVQVVLYKLVAVVLISRWAMPFSLSFWPEKAPARSLSTAVRWSPSECRIRPSECRIRRRRPWLSRGALCWLLERLIKLSPLCFRSKSQEGQGLFFISWTTYWVYAGICCPIMLLVPLAKFILNFLLGLKIFEGMRKKGDK